MAAKTCCPMSFHTNAHSRESKWHSLLSVREGLKTTWRRRWRVLSGPDPCWSRCGMVSRNSFVPNTTSSRRRTSGSVWSNTPCNHRQGSAEARLLHPLASLCLPEPYVGLVPPPFCCEPFFNEFKTYEARDDHTVVRWPVLCQAGCISCRCGRI